MTEKSCLFSREPRWRVRCNGANPAVPAALRSWLDEEGSLTRRLRAACGSQFAVKLLGQHWGRPFRNETVLLGLRMAERALVREVRLQKSDVPLVLARTIIPHSTLKGAQRCLAHLGTRPLGEVIFSYSKLKRLELAVTQVRRCDWSMRLEVPSALRGEVWGRRSVYSIGGKNLLVCEFFLPEILSLREHHATE